MKRYNDWMTTSNELSLTKANKHKTFGKLSKHFKYAILITLCFKHRIDWKKVTGVQYSHIVINNDQ